MRSPSVTNDNGSTMNNTGAEKMYPAIKANTKRGTYPALIYRFQDENKKDMCYVFNHVRPLWKGWEYVCIYCKNGRTTVRVVDYQFVDNPVNLYHNCEPRLFAHEMAKRDRFTVPQNWMNNSETPKRTSLSSVPGSISKKNAPVIADNDDNISDSDDVLKIFLSQCRPIVENIGEMYIFAKDGVKGLYGRTIEYAGSDWSTQAVSDPQEWETSTLPTQLPANVPGSFFFMVNRNAFGKKGLEQISRDMFSPWGADGSDSLESCVMQVLTNDSFLKTAARTHFKFPYIKRHMTYTLDIHGRPTSDILYQYIVTDASASDSDAVITNFSAETRKRQANTEEHIMKELNLPLKRYITDEQNQTPRQINGNQTPTTPGPLSSTPIARMSMNSGGVPTTPLTPSLPAKVQNNTHVFSVATPSTSSASSHQTADTISTTPATLQYQTATPVQAVSVQNPSIQQTSPFPRPVANGTSMALQQQFATPMQAVCSPNPPQMTHHQQFGHSLSSSAIPVFQQQFSTPMQTVSARNPSFKTAPLHEQAYHAAGSLEQAIAEGKALYNSLQSAEELAPVNQQIMELMSARDELTKTIERVNKAVKNFANMKENVDKTVKNIENKEEKTREVVDKNGCVHIKEENID